MIIEFFRPALVRFRIEEKITPRLVSRVGYGFDQWSVVSFVIKKLFVYLFIVKQCIYVVIQMYLMHIYFHLLRYGNKFTDVFLVNPTRNVNYIGK